MPITTQQWSDSDYLNGSDMNRIESNMAATRTYLTTLTYSFPAFTTVVNRTFASADYISSLNRIEQNLDALRANFITPDGYLPKETWTVGKSLDFNMLNRWEMNTQLLYDYGALVYSSFRYCGQFTCGGGGLY